MGFGRFFEMSAKKGTGETPNSLDARDVVLDMVLACFGQRHRRKHRLEPLSLQCRRGREVV